MDHYFEELEDSSQWPVLHFVEQLASQEPELTFGQPNLHQSIIEWVVKQQDPRPCRLTIRSSCKATMTDVCPDESSQVRVEGGDVMVYDIQTGFVKSTFRGDESHGCGLFSRWCNNVSHSVHQIALMDCSTIYIIDAQTCKIERSMYCKATDEEGRESSYDENTP
jgi:hypothetical protein